MSKVSYVTAEGMKKLRGELDHLISVERPAISKMIAEARDKGDLSENAEYDAAKEAQGLLELKISNLKEVVSSARLIDESRMDSSKVQILSKVKIENIHTKKEVEYMIVSESEADFKLGKISINTPIAKGLLGKKVGELTEVVVPSGKMEFKIIDISR